MKAASGTRPRVAVLEEREILRRERFLEELDEVSTGLGIPPSEARAAAARCLEEMATHPEERHLDRMARLARFMISRSYDPKLDINVTRLAELKSLSGRHPLIFLWSHRSYLDGFVFLRTLYEHDFRPQPLSFAGINMNFPLFGSLARRSGAVFLRRSFRDDDIYRLVFRHYIDYLVELRLPLSWSIEGTRSRTGKLNPPKFGLIQWVVDACRRNASEDALLVPVSISFDQIAEIDDYSAMQRGLPKRRESLRWFLGYIRGMRMPCGRIYVRFAEPLTLSRDIDLTDALFDSDSPAERIRVQKLAFEVCSRIEHTTPIHSADLLTVVLLAANGRALTVSEIRDQAAQVLDLVVRRGLPHTAVLGQDVGEELPATLEALARTRLLEVYEDGMEPVWRIAPGKELAAAYYRNTIVHYFLAGGIAEVALALAIVRAAADRTTAVPDAMLEIRDLLKFEFFFRRKPEFLADATGFMEQRYPGWRSEHKVFGKTPPLFGHGLLRSFIEAYRILAAVLLHEGVSVSEEGLPGTCLDVGEEMLRRRQIGSESALSAPLFANAVRLARHRGLIGEAGAAHADRRETFMTATGELMAAITLLQRRYDRAIGSTIGLGSPACDN